MAAVSDNEILLANPVAKLLTSCVFAYMASIAAVSEMLSLSLSAPELPAYSA